jgi:uncharacterized protein (TIGR03083 family)
MIQTVHLLPILDQKLIELLKSLSPEDWNKPTIAKLWTVKDIAAHLLDGNYRTLCLARDQHVLVPDRDITSYETLVAYLNQLNADWVKATKRLSPRVLTELLESTGREYSAYMASLDGDDTAIFSVAWAGEQTSRNWFHIAREYTEKWHHQQQIREATGKPGIMTKELFHPFISTLLRALPHTYRNTSAPENTTVRIIVESGIGGEWTLRYNNSTWVISDAPSKTAESSISIPPDVAWKLFTKGLTPQAAEPMVTITGDRALASVALGMIAIMG